MEPGQVPNESGEAPAFSPEEYQSRLRRVREEMRARTVDLLLLTSPENIYYLSGYRTTGYYMYQCLLVPASGSPRFVVRKLEMTNVRGLSWIKEGIALEDNQDPLDGTVAAVTSCGGREGRIGFEDGGFFLPPRILAGLQERLPKASWVPASAAVERCRVIKSPQEIAYIRKAADAAVAGLKEGMEEIRPGRTENDVVAAVYRGMLQAGSEYPSSPPYVVAGRRSALAHASFEGQPIRAGEIVYSEVGGCYKRYGGSIMRTVAVGGASSQVRRMATTMMRALDAAIEAIKPGVTSGAVDDAGRRLVTEAGLGGFWLHRTGYSIGVGFPPGWGEGHVMDLKPGDARVLEAGMTFHLVPLILVPEVGGIGYSETVLVTPTGCEVLTDYPRTLEVH